MMVKNEYSSLYVLKASAALLVLMVHFEFYKRQYFTPLYTCGVPLFFIISVFFVYAESFDKMRGKIMRSIKKLIKLIVFFNFAYFVLYLAINGKSNIQSFHDMIRLIIYGDAIAGHLWFLNSYVWTLVLFMLFLGHKKGYQLLGIVSILWTILSLSERQYSFIFGFDYCFTQNYWLPSLGVSLPMMYMGLSLKKYEDKIIKIMSYGGAILNLFLFIAICLLYMEHRLLCIGNHYSGGMMISTYIASAYFFYFCICRRNLGKGTMVAEIGKKHSANIYYWQFYPYCLFVSSIIAKYQLQNLSLLIMIVVLLGWSVCEKLVVAQFNRLENKLK